jgi:hypothetical protein
MAMASGASGELGAPIFRHSFYQKHPKNPGLLMMRWQVLVAKNQKKMAGEVTHCWVLKPWIPPHANLPSSPPSHLHLPPEGCVLPKPRRRCCRTFYSQKPGETEAFCKAKPPPASVSFWICAPGRHNIGTMGTMREIDHTPGWFQTKPLWFLSHWDILRFMIILMDNDNIMK